MSSYRIAFLISVTVNMIQYSTSRELLLFNTSPNSQHVIFPFPYRTHYKCRYYVPIVCSDVPVNKNGKTQVAPTSDLIQRNLPRYQSVYEKPSQSDAVPRHTHNLLRYQMRNLVSKEVKKYEKDIESTNLQPRFNSLTNLIYDKNMLIPYRRNLNDELEDSYAIFKTHNINDYDKPVSEYMGNDMITNISSPDKVLVHSKMKNVSVIEQTGTLDNMNKQLISNTKSKNCLVKNKESDIQNKSFYNSNAYPLNNGAVPLNDEILFEKFRRNVDELERKFYQVSFDKLSANSPPGRQENGISFAQSGLFLHFVLMMLSAAADSESKVEIEKCLNFNVSDTDRKILIHHVLASMPFSDDELKFRFSSRLVLGHDIKLNDNFNDIGETMQLKVGNFNGTENPAQLMSFLNNLVELDSGGAMHNTFDEDELSNGVSAVMISMLYIRGRWRSAPTLLNGTSYFRDAGERSEQTFGAIRINDIMRYAEFSEWDAEAIEISYATPGLSLLLLVPRDTSLRRLTKLVTTTSVDTILQNMHSLRVAVSIPLYTLRMTLLLPSKLEGLGVTKLLDTSMKNDTLKLSHAIQRIMFWSEAGRHAFKDDGIEWDDPPELELVVDRPYIFFVRWNDLTLLTGNFVL